MENGSSTGPLVLNVALNCCTCVGNIKTLAFVSGIEDGDCSALMKTDEEEIKKYDDVLVVKNRYSSVSPSE